MRQTFLTVSATFAVLFLISGCFTPNYDKIPLEKGEIPYILADGDYTDIDGNVHKDQHNVWAMQEADVYNYVKGLAPSRTRRGFWGEFQKLKEIDGKTLLLGALALLSAFLGIKLIVSRHKNRPTEDYEHYPDETEGD